MRAKIRMITSHIDKHNERVSLSALQDLVGLINKQYTPMGVEHDPRIPPVGRVLSAYLEELEDGEFAVDGIAEIFEEGEEIEFRDDGREIPVGELSDRLRISPDRSFRNSDDQQLLEEMRALIDGELVPQIKKSVEPISLMILAASFAAGGIASGFLNKIGEDAWDLFKAKLIGLMNRKEQQNKERLLAFEFTVHQDDHLLYLETILANPTESDINKFLEEGLRRLDESTPRFFKRRHYLTKVVFEYKGDQLRVIFGLRKDGVPISVDLDK
ncbi:MAG: hypothetical protein KC415_13990 [Anaerolineales bacterium]|nr:hypothetical protein [Anaerolineales bacterium]MCB9005469.1 hypothetical protein [Ardenticatenaceae bacterium]